MSLRGGKIVKQRASSCIRALWCRLGIILSPEWRSCSGPLSASQVQCLSCVFFYLQCILIQTFDESNSGATFSLHPLLQANFPYCSLISLHLSPLQPFLLSFLVPKVPPTRFCHPPSRSFKLFFRIAFRTNTSFSFTKSLCFSA